jgi:hypothetical protein
LPAALVNSRMDCTIDGTGMEAAAAAVVVDAWETQSQADPTGFHVNVLEIAGTAQTGNDNGADINELQTDWANGGRLDNILDARSSQTSVDDLPTNAELAAALGTADDAVLTAIDALPTAAENADAVWDEALSGHNSGGTAGKVLMKAEEFIAHDGVAQAGGASTVTLDAGASAVTDFYKPGIISIVNGTGAGQFRRIVAYDGETKIATVATAWATNPDETSEFQITPWATVRVSEMDNDVISADAIAASAVTEIQAGLATDAAVADLPTNAGLATALAGADDATLAAIAALHDFDPATVEVLANVKKVNDVTIVGDGVGTPMGA